MSHVIKNRSSIPKTPEEVPAKPNTEPEIAPNPETPTEPDPAPSPNPSPQPATPEPIPDPNESEKIRRERDFRPQMQAIT